MTPNFILLNVSSLALICLLAAFARHNKKAGWVKTRSTFVEDLRLLQEAWDEADQPIAIAQTAILQNQTPAIAPVSSPTFIAQLSNLQSALNSGAPRVVSPEVAAETGETVSK